MGELQILENNQLALPAECVKCGTGRSIYKYVDIGRHVEPYGRIYFCSACMIEIATELGYVEGSKYEQLGTEYEEYQATVVDLQDSHAERVAELTREIEARDVLLASKYTSSVPSLDSAGDGDLRNDNATKDSEESRKPARKTGARSPKQNSGGGSQVVPDLKEFLDK